MPDLVNNKMTGFKFIIKRGDPNGVLMELWQDKNDQWELVNSSIGIDPGWIQLPSDHQITFASGPVRKGPSLPAPSKKEGLLSLSEQLEKLK